MLLHTVNTVNPPCSLICKTSCQDVSVSFWLKRSCSDVSFDYWESLIPKRIDGQFNITKQDCVGPDFIIEFPSIIYCSASYASCFKLLCMVKMIIFHDNNIIIRKLMSLRLVSGAAYTHAPGYRPRLLPYPVCLADYSMKLLCLYDV
jgi:hypothetical protein